MQSYTEKQPKFTAVRFTLATVHEVTDLAQGGNYTIVVEGGFPAVMTIKGLTLPVGDYLVRAPNGDLSVVTDREMRERFDLVPDQKSRIDKMQAPQRVIPKAEQWPPHILAIYKQQQDLIEQTLGMSPARPKDWEFPGGCGAVFRAKA